MNYPMYAEIRGKQYPINTDYRVGLNCFKAIDDEDITDVERTISVIGLLYGVGVIPEEDMEEALRIASLFLQCGETKKDYEKKPLDIDFNYDEKLIMASFLSDYRIDLDNTEYMHFWKYCALISGLTENTILNKVRDIRNYDLNEIKDGKDKGKMVRAKKQVELPKKRTKAEKEALNEFEESLSPELRSIDE